MGVERGRYSRRIHHGDSDCRDLILLTRKPSKIPFDNLSKIWGGTADAKERLALFLLYNRQSFMFLSVDVSTANDGTPAVIFQPNEKVGCAPLFSPINGKVCASIIINGNMNEDVSEILPLIEDDLEIDYSEKLVLPYKVSIQPPIYFECAKYVEQYYVSRRLHWKKFISEERTENYPTSSTNWTKYAVNSFNPYNRLIFQNKKNLLSENHPEWRELNFVLNICLEKLSSTHTPKKSRRAYRDKIEDLKRKVNFRNIQKPTELRVRSADPLEIKKLKEIGNRILNSVSSEYRAWSLDFSKLFERYVQYLFTQLEARIGVHILCNYKFSISGTHKEWELSYLEPDIIIEKGDKAVFADAKYKMHLFNVGSKNVLDLKESFRHDLHQILAYSSFDKNRSKTAVLVYPYNSFMCLRQKISASILSSSVDVYLVGVPWGDCYSRENGCSLNLKKKIEISVNGLMELILKNT